MAAPAPVTIPPALYTALAGVGIAVFMLVLDMIKSAVQNWRENRRKAKQSSLPYLAEKQVTLDQAAERICLEMEADHAAIYRLHNGEFFEGNDSIKKMSMASEAPAMARWKIESQSMLMSNFPHLVLALDGPDKQPFYLITPENVLDFELGRLLNVRDYASCVALLVRGKKDRPLAILMLSWWTRKVEMLDLDLLALNAYRRDLSFTLSD